MANTPPNNVGATAVSPSQINLNWSNPDYYQYIEVYRDSGYMGYIQGNSTSYQDNTCQDGTAYSYQLKCFKDEEEPALSNAAGATTPLGTPSGCEASIVATNTAHASWVDNSQHETDFDVYINVDSGAWSLHETLGANSTGSTAYGLSSGHWYGFKVRARNAVMTSPWSNEAYVYTAPPPNAPSLLTATTTATTKILLNWTDNSGNETAFHIEMSSTGPTSGFSEIATVGANVKTYEKTGLTSNQQYWFRVRAHNDSGYSAYCAVANAVTYAAIAAPTNLACLAAKVGGVYCVEVNFDDNSELEDLHSVERKTGAGAFAEIGTVVANRTYARDTTAAAGTTYTYRVRAKQGASTYSAYSNEVAITVPNVPTDPTDLAVTEYQDTWIRIGWTLSAAEVGYSIERSVSGGAYTEIARITAGVNSFKATGLTAGLTYGFKVRAYNGAGYSGYTAAVTQETRLVYESSRFEKLIRNSKPKIIFLVEVNPLMELSGWTIVDGQTYTYQASFDEAGAAPDAVYENGVALTRKTTIAALEATAGTWGYSSVTKLVYVHPTGDGAPIDFTYTGSFWLYFTTWQRGSTIYNGNFYLPLVASDGIPDISQTIQPFFEGTFAISSGTVSLINGKIKKAFHFDKKFAKYLWLNRKARILAGGEGFIYSEFRTINTGTINSVGITDQRINLDLRDSRDGFHRDLPVEKYSLDMFPFMDDDRKDTERPFGFGAITNAVPVCIDVARRSFEFHASRVKAVSVTQNGTTLTENTHYFVDYQRGRITLARTLAYTTSDIILVSFTGCVNLADEANVTGAEVFMYICREWLGCALADMDLDAIYETKYSKPTALSLYVRNGNSQDIIRTIEQSTQAHTLQDAEGRLGIRAERLAAASDAPYVWNLHVFDFMATKAQDQLYSAVNIYYGENPSNDLYSLSQTLRTIMTWRYGINKSLDIYVALAGVSDAAALGTAIANMMDRQQISFKVPRVLYTCFPGDVIYFNRTRFPSLSGSAANVSIRLLGVSKLISSGKTEITAEVL